ncbi:HD-GYP domain-containing protein [Lederbergia citri]|uniref:HD-GYP domain-containing protein n=1 Tax=Lederbergia citri TaxID=2833580 RepID=A0A942TGF3_9BACI|nr:HD-GYP domain-containing protein [Lederbergia citri]MBS4196438.1 HD-GYP domain-containing protein [Lederbergia citri]
MKNYSFIGPLIAVALPFAIFEFLRGGLFDDPLFIMPRGHFYIVSAVSILSTILAIAVGVVGKRLRNIKISFLALSFISLALVFALHGLSTPHFLLPETHIPGVAAQLSMLLATIWLWLSSLPSDHKFVEKLSQRQSMLVPGWILALSIFGIASINFPNIMHFIPLNVKPLNWFVTAIVLLLNIITITRYYRTYRFSRFPLQISIVYSAGWFIVSQLIMILGEIWRLSWWIYHFLLLASMIVMLIGLIKQYVVRGSFVGAIRALFTNDPFERITNSASPSVKALVVTTEKKDTYTMGHTFRVTMYALKLGEELKLKPEQLRAIAQGALVHDVGKISIPDSILNKPGKLSSEERETIETHPVNGYEMCRDLGFMKEELSIIRSHHEKWDGSGYPDKLQGEEIGLLARIVAVADVYDALTSERSYRKAWTHNEAVKYLIEQKGIHFDPKFVDAWVNLCERNPTVYQYPSSTINNDTTSSLISSF